MIARNLEDNSIQIAQKKSAVIRFRHSLHKLKQRQPQSPSNSRDGTQGRTFQITFQLADVCSMQVSFERKFFLTHTAGIAQFS